MCVCVKDGDSKLVEPSQPSCCGDVIETPECFQSLVAAVTVWRYTPPWFYSTFHSFKPADLVKTQLILPFPFALFLVTLFFFVLFCFFQAGVERLNLNMQLRTMLAAV